MFSSIPGLSLLDAIASAPLSRCDKQMSPAIAKCPLGAESAQFGPNGLKLAGGGYTNEGYRLLSGGLA